MTGQDRPIGIGRRVRFPKRKRRRNLGAMLEKDKNADGTYAANALAHRALFEGQTHSICLDREGRRRKTEELVPKDRLNSARR